MDRRSDFAGRLKIVMTEMKYNYEQLGAKLQMKPQTLNRYILGQRVPKVNVANEIAAKLGVNPLWLQGYDVGMYEDKHENESACVRCGRIPVMGRAAAGDGGGAPGGYDGYDYADVPRPEEYVYYRVEGDSMEPRILGGALALVHKQAQVSSGDLAVVVIGGEVMLKRIIRQNGSVVLQAFNPDYPPVVMAGDELKSLHIVGKVVETKTKW